MKISVFVSLLAILSPAFGFAPQGATTSSCRSGHVSLGAYQTVSDAIAEAQHICSQEPGSEACRVAWDIVEELEAADSHYRSAPGTYTPLEAARGGAMPPPAPRMGSMDNDIAAAKDIGALLGGFDILAQRVDTKMDQLMATTEKLIELGADDPAVAEMGHRAAEMKNIIRYVHQYINSH